MIAPSFAAIVRTTGERPEELQQALQSLTFQVYPTKAIVVVHGDATAWERTAAVCSSVKGLDYTQLHASDRIKRRGYPANTGLEYCGKTRPDFFFFLDDDDIVYPFFTRSLFQTAATSLADVIYAASNSRQDNSTTELAYRTRPIFSLFYENCIPINSFIVRTASWIRHPVYFDESYEYLEDWKFLLNLLEHGYRFQPSAAPVSEFRLYSNRVRGHAAEWKRHSLQVREYINKTFFRLPGSALVADTQLHISTLGDSVRETHSQQIAELHNRISDLEQSYSWRVTAPLRIVGGQLLMLWSRLKNSPGVQNRGNTRKSLRL